LPGANESEARTRESGPGIRKLWKKREMDVIVGNRIIGFLTHSSESIRAFSHTTWVLVIYWGLNGTNALVEALFQFQAP